MTEPLVQPVQPVQPAQPVQPVQPDVSIIIVNWNTVDYLRDCLRSVFAETQAVRCEVIVVDNASGDDSVAMVRAEYPQVAVIPNDKNLGFPAANNQGIAVSRGRYVLLLNSDTLIIDDAIDKLVQFMDQHPAAGAAGGTLLCRDLTVDPLCLRKKFDAATAWAEYLFLPALRDRLLGRPKVGQTVEVDVLIGAYMMVRREAIHQVGGLDERFFLSAEDIDWAMSIRKGGWKVYYYPPSRIIHYGSQSFKRSWDRGIITSYHSKELLFAKHYGALDMAALRLAALAGSLIRLAGWRLRAARAGGEDRIDALIRCSAYRQVILYALRVRSYAAACASLKSYTQQLHDHA